MKDFSASHNPQFLSYVENVFQPEDSFLKSIRLRAHEAGLPPIHVGPFDGRHLTVLAAAINAKKIVEIGTLGGYSGVCLLRALPNDSFLWTIDISQKHADFAHETFTQAGLQKQVSLMVGPGLEKLAQLNHNPYDLIFIDANKNDYPHYWNWAKSNVRIGGCILADNTFAWGHLHNPSEAPEHRQEFIRSLQSYNQLAATDENFVTTALPTGEGLTLSVRIR